MDIEKVNNLLEKKEFFDKICEMKSAEEVQKAFKENGLALSIEDIKELERINHKVIEKMNSHELENIAGGGAKSYHFFEGVVDGLLPKAQKDTKKYGTSIEPKNKTQKIFRKAGKVFAWTICLSAMPITRLLDSSSPEED